CGSLSWLTDAVAAFIAEPDPSDPEEPDACTIAYLLDLDPLALHSLQCMHIAAALKSSGLLPPETTKSHRGQGR
ncbi:unnamed protein product, partial [Amoebophrya sp. A25]